MGAPMLNSLSLFSGYAGIDLALVDYCKPILYCEKEEYAQAIILSRMDDGALPFAPIWNDVTTLDGRKFGGLVDIITGGFPCQDISSAGKGAGLAGKRSGLFYEIVRLTKEIRPIFVFLENVPAIRARGLEQVVKEFTEMGYDCRWTMLSAASVGAPHKRERWFFLAHANGELIWEQSGRGRGQDRENKVLNKLHVENGLNPNTDSQPEGLRQSKEWFQDDEPLWVMESDNWDDNAGFFLRMGYGDKVRAHRVKALGNGVVPKQVKKAFEILAGFTRKRR